jgi:spore coat assembly protein
MRVGDMVVRKSHNKDIVFRIVGFVEDDSRKKMAILKGVALRIIADSYIDDLERIEEYDIHRYIIDREVESLLYKVLRDMKEKEKKYYRQTNTSAANTYGRPGKVLHLDGDSEYLKICLEVYAKLGIPAVGKAIAEENQYKEIRALLEEHNPDILVITGHDSILNSKGDLKDVGNYRNTTSFIKAVKEARKYEPSLDNLVILAGACQANYEEIVKCGANCASSPHRIMIHALDPVFIVEKIACSRIDKVVPLEEVFEHTITGTKGVGGLETKGKYRLAMPKSIYE